MLLETLYGLVSSMCCVGAVPLIRVSAQTDGAPPEFPCPDQQQRSPQRAISSTEAHPEVEVSSHAENHPLEPQASSGLCPLTLTAASEADEERVLTPPSQRIVPNAERKEQALVAAAAAPDASTERQDAPMTRMNPPEQDPDAAEAQTPSRGALERLREMGKDGRDAAEEHAPSCGALERLREMGQNDTDAAEAQTPSCGALERLREREQDPDAAEAHTPSRGALERLRERETDGSEGLEGDGGRVLGRSSSNTRLGAAEETAPGLKTQEKCPREISTEEKEEEIKRGIRRQSKGLEGYRDSGMQGPCSTDTPADPAKETTLRGLKTQQRLQMRGNAENREKEDGRVHGPLNRLRHGRNQINDDEDAGIPEEIMCLNGDLPVLLPPLTEINGGAVSVSTTARSASHASHCLFQLLLSSL